MEGLFPIAFSLGLVSLLVLAVSPAAGMVAVFIVKPLIDASWEHDVLFGLHPTEIYSALIPLLLLCHMALAKEESALARMPLKGMWLSYSAYIVVFSMIVAYSDELKTGANVFFRYINGLVGFYVLQAFFRRDDRFKWFLWALILGGLFPMSLGLYQAVTGFQWRPEQAEGLARNIGIWHDGVNMRTYAQQTILGLLLYSALYVKPGNLPLKATVAAYLAISTLVMVRVYSKAAILTFALWILCWTVLRRRFVMLALAGVTGLLLTTYYAGDLLEHVGTLFRKEVGFLTGEVDGKMTFHGRWFGWIEMVNKWERLPAANQLFGSGELATGAHNDFLQMLFHGGVVGLCLYLALLAMIGIQITRHLLVRADVMAVAALMVYLMWLIDAIGLVPSAYPSEQWLIWGIVGLSFRLRADEGDLQQATAPAVSAVDTPAAAGIGLPGRRFPLLSDAGRS